MTCGVTAQGDFHYDNIVQPDRLVDDEGRLWDVVASYV